MSFCKYKKQQKQVSMNSGQTWSDVSPAEYRKGDFIEMDSLDCQSTLINRWITVPNDYICENGNKYEKLMGQYSLDNGQTWESYYPSVYDLGNIIESNTPKCHFKWEGHYLSGLNNECDSPSKRFVEGRGCITIPSTTPLPTYFKKYVDPVKYVRCSQGSSTLTRKEVLYFDKYELFEGYIGDCVTTIGEGAFANYLNSTIKNSLSTITIPDNVTTIGKQAFYGCSGLTSITINATTPPTIGSDVFRNTHNCPIYVPCESVNAYKSASGWSTYASRIYGTPPCAQYRWVESGTTCIGYDKYQNNIKQVSTDGINWENVVPAEYSASTLIETHSEDCGYVPSPKWIATYTGGTTSSAECSSSNAITQNEIDLTDLTSVEIKDCVSTLGFRAFKQATSLTSVTMADTVTLISGETFAVCTALTSVNLSTGLTTISGSSFQNCPSLTSVTIPASVQRIGSRVFERCSGLTRVTVLTTTPPSLASYVFDDTNNCPIYVPCDSVNAYKSASGWSTYASRIVGNCPKWTATYSDSHTESAQCGSSSAITNNEITKSGLTSVEIGDCVTSIGQNVFSGCTNLTSITIPNSVTSIGGGAFWNCSGLTSVTIPSGVTTIEGWTFYNCDGLTSITIPSGVTSIGTSAFMSCSNIEDITIPNTVTSIGTYVFSNCISLQTVTLPNSITTLPDNTFRECDNLAMINSENIGEFNIPSGVITLGYGLFTSCYALQYLIIPSTVTTIEKNILQGCRNVVIECNAVNPPALTDTLGGSIAQIRVPSASVEAYKSASGWSQYANKIYPN